MEGWKSSGLIKVAGIPAPSGQYQVGCTDLMQEGGLLVRLFYPTNEGNGEYQYTPSRPHPKYTKALFEFLEEKGSGIKSSLINGLLNPRIPALSGAPLFKTTDGHSDDPFPILVYSHGLGGHRSTYCTICCDMASHGYVVGAVEHKDQSACLTFNRVPGPGVPRGEYDRYVNEWVPYLNKPKFEFPLRNRQVQQRSEEVRKTLDLLQLLNDGGEIRNMMGGDFDFSQFQGRLNLDLVAVMGHSFGGATTIQTLSEDQRFKCGICLDCWMFPLHRDLYGRGVDQPFMFINSFEFQWAENVSSMMKLVKPVDETGISKCFLVTLKGTTHFTQTDAPYIVPTFYKKFNLASLDKYISFSVNSELCHSFFKRFLLADPSYQGCVPILDGTDGASEHVLYGTNINWQEAKENDNTSNDNPGLEEPVDEKQVVDEDGREIKQQVKEEEKQVIEEDVKEDKDTKQDMKDENIQSKM